MEQAYLVAITVISISGLAAVVAISTNNQSANRKMLERLTNAVMASDTNEYITLTKVDEQKESPKKVTEDESQYIPLDQMTDEDWDKVGTK